MIRIKKIDAESIVRLQGVDGTAVPDETQDPPRPMVVRSLGQSGQIVHSDGDRPPAGGSPVALRCPTTSSLESQRLSTTELAVRAPSRLHWAFNSGTARAAIADAVWRATLTK